MYCRIHSRNRIGFCVRYMLRDQILEEEIGRAYTAHESKIYTKYNFGNLRVREHLVDLCVDGALVLTEY